jgi:formate hydrogenlyase transcriptional activator
MIANAERVIPLDSSAARSVMIGSQPGLRSVWRALEMVARTDSAVLILGETGTGKELVARAIHAESVRKCGPYVTLNCPAIPNNLLESELYGHERGAFTGAVARTTGRFQLANNGTLVLDEIGDLPLELQPKLLRVLQEHEFERVGGSQTVRVDVRIVAATNLNLLEMVRERRFRADLFYRLNVFPITVPPLRERSDDIPILVQHFVREFGSRMRKQIIHVAPATMEFLQQYDWPGNVRELQHFVERAVIMSSGPKLEIPFGELTYMVKGSMANDGRRLSARTLAEVERDHILDVLRQVRGVVGGRNGAAVRLGLPRTTLMSRMHKLGIAPQQAFE